MIFFVWLYLFPCLITCLFGFPLAEREDFPVEQVLLIAIAPLFNGYCAFVLLADWIQEKIGH